MLLSPAAQFTLAAMNLMGTGPSMARRWNDASTRHQSVLNDVLFDSRPRLLLLVPTLGKVQGQEGRTIIGFNRRPLPTVASLPPFRPPVQGLRENARDVILPLMLMACYASALILVSVVAFSRLRF